MYSKIISYCHDNDLSISAFEKKCGIGNGVVGRWNPERENSKPNLSTLTKIALATGIDIPTWLEKT